MALIEMDITVQADIGIAPAEIGTLQTLNVALVVQLVEDYTNVAAGTGDIAHTLDYGCLRSIVHAVFAQQRWNLLEQVSTRIRELILELEQVKSAQVAITKYYPWPDVARLTLSR